MNKSTPRKCALILGATGGFGSAITRVMANNGWQVKALCRQPRDAEKNIQWISGDLDHPESLRAVANGVDVIVHAVNVPYPKWDPVMVNYTASIIELAQNADAHLIFIGNVYNLGIPDDGVIRCDSPDAPVNEKGKVRSSLEQMIRMASAEGLRATIMRFGDFFGPGVNKNNWFYECTKNVHKNSLAAAGPIDLPHTWAYLPDAAAATEKVATTRLQATELPNLMVLPFRGHVFSSAELRQEIEKLTGQSITLSNVPWKLFKGLGVVWPLMRDLVSMRYLWQHNIQLDGSALTELIGEPTHTSLSHAVQQTIPGLPVNQLIQIQAGNFLSTPNRNRNRQ